MMSDIELQLGPVAFGINEISGPISWGGQQRLAVHQLPGGVRVVDTLGRDDSEVSWAGIFSGPDAADRARSIDVLRVNGDPIVLTWGAFLYTAIIARFEPDYASPCWIPYRLSCLVVRDEAAAANIPAVTLAVSVADDLASAASFADVSAIQTASNATGAMTYGSQANQSLVVAVSATRSSVDQNLAIPQPALASDDLTTSVAAAGQLANLAASRGFLARLHANLVNASP